MSDVSSSLILLLLALLLLWLAVTDKLSLALDAFDVARGKKKAVEVASAGVSVLPQFSLPSIPALSSLNHVTAS